MGDKTHSIKIINIYNLSEQATWSPKLIHINLMEYTSWRLKIHHPKQFLDYRDSYHVYAGPHKCEITDYESGINIKIVPRGKNTRYKLRDICKIIQRALDHHQVDPAYRSNLYTKLMIILVDVIRSCEMLVY